MDKPHKYPYKRDKKTNRDVHVLVWESVNGPVPSGHVIHHINENPRDNRIENLELKTRSQHAKDHFSGIPLNERFSEESMEKIKEAWKKNGEKMRKSPDGDSAYCNICKQMLPCDAFSRNISRYNGLMDTCKACRSAYRKELELRKKLAKEVFVECLSTNTIPTEKTGESHIMAQEPVTVPVAVMADVLIASATGCTNMQNA